MIVLEMVAVYQKLSIRLQNSHPTRAVIIGGIFLLPHLHHLKHMTPTAWPLFPPLAQINLMIPYLKVTFPIPVVVEVQLLQLA
jgi:hypothetical protein